MAGRDIIMMSQRELRRLHIIHKVLDRKIRQLEAASILDLTNRQIRRAAKRVKTEGDKGIIHRSRGRPSNRRLSKRTKDKAIRLYRQKYLDFGPTLAAEKLFEIDKMKIATQTLRNWLIEDGLWQVSRKVRKHRQWRERKHHFGEMVQMDGSHHAWFEGRGPEVVFIGYIDDATNTAFGRFYGYEGTIPAMDSFKRYIRRYGLPNSIYLDKHTTYKSSAKPSIEDQLNNQKPLSQFERAVGELGVEIIHANSPQAKGRIERLFKTFQDRLIKEMRLRNIKTLDAANRFLGGYLPIHNRRFGLTPAEKDNLHRPLPPKINLNTILCIRTEHTLRNDFTIARNKRLYQIMDHITAKKVTVEERVSGKMLITYQGKHLKYKHITQPPERQKNYAATIRRAPTPPMDHPLKRAMYEARLRREKAAQKQKELLLTKT